VFGASTVGAAALFAATGYRAPPERWDLSLGLAFGTSIVWISCAATELLECLTILGAAMVGLCTSPNPVVTPDSLKAPGFNP
jgi:hypothetical protein